MMSQNSYYMLCVFIFLTLSRFILAFENRHFFSTGSHDLVKRTASKFEANQFLGNVSLQEDYHSSKNESITSLCVPWMYLSESSHKCECGKDIHGIISCDSSLNRTLILDCYCMTVTQYEEQVVGSCLYGCSNTTKKESNQLDPVYNRLPSNVADVNEFTCGLFNKTGKLCGECKDGFSPLVYSYKLQCMNCTNMNYNWVKYVAAAYIPLTFFFFFVVLFNFNGTSPKFSSFIVISQAIGSPINMRALFNVAAKGYGAGNYFVSFLGCLYGFWNLDFFRTVIPNICLDIPPLLALSLDYVIAFYPLALVFITYILVALHSRDVRVVVWLWRPFGICLSYIKRDWKIQGSIVNAFATFFLLSYVKLLNVSFDLIVPVPIHNMNATTLGWYLYNDGTVEFMSKEHLPYGIVSIFVSIVFIMFPLLLLLLYPMSCFQRCLNRIWLRRQSLDMFMNCFQGHYSDGTEGTRDCRYFAALYFIDRILAYTAFSLVQGYYCYGLCALIILVSSILIVLVKPYKKQFSVYNTVDAVLMLVFSMLLVSLLCIDIADVKSPYVKSFSLALMIILLISPLLYVIAITFAWLYKHILKRFKFVRCCIQKLRKNQEQVDLDRLLDRDDLQRQEAVNHHIQAPCNRYGSIIEVPKP